MNPDYALERLRQKLLDLTLRNRLLNFRKTASSIECIDESPRRVFRRLVDRGRPLGLEPLEEGDSEDPVGAPTPQRSPSSPNPLPANEQPPFPAGSHQSFAPGDSPTGARGPMAEPSESVVPTQPPRRERSRDDPLQTPLDSPTFDRRLRRVLTDAREAIESTGVNLLHLALGFLEWHETDAPDSPVRAPLVLVPVVLERRRVKTGRRENGREIYRYAYRLAYNGEDLSQNISLAAKLRQDFGIDLPTLESDDPETDEPFDVERYFEQVQASVSVHPTGRNWRVQRDVVLGFFSFAKHRMHLDLDPASWPTGRSLLESELARDLLLGRDLQPVTFPSAAEVEEEQARGTLSLVLDADSTQYAALLHALRGHNLVIEGPPGTGKSQTITNLIAAALAQGKTVLFVAEKLAALEVVRHKLDAVDLGSFCLELHSHKAKMSLVLDDLRRRLRLESEDPPYKKDPRRRLNARRETLNAFASLVAQPFAPSRDRVEEILWNAVAASEAEAEARRSSGHEPLPNALPLEFGPSSEWSATRIDDARELLSNVAEHLRDGVHRDAACWRGWSADRLLPNDHELVKVRLESALTLARTLQSSMRDFARRNGLDDSLSLRDIELLHVLEPARLAPPAKLNAAFLEAAYLGDVGAATVEAFFESLESFHESLLKVRDRLPRAETLDAERLEALRDDWQALRERGCAPERRVDFGSVERDLALVSRQLERIALGIETSSRFPELEGASTHRELRIAIDILALLAWRGGLSVDELCAEMAAPLARARFQRAASEGAELEERRRLLESHFSLRDAPEGEALRELRQTLRAARGGIFAWLPWGRAARARRELKTFARDPRATRRPETLPLLESLEDFLQSRREFDGSEELATTLGPLFRGLESDWERLRTAVSWCDRLRELCGEERAREIIDDLGSQVAALEAAQREGLEVVELRESLERLESVFAGGSAAEPWPGDAGLPLAELRERVEETFDLVRSTNESIAAGAIAANATFGEITGALDELWKVRSLRAELVDSPLGEAALGEDLEAFVAKLESARVTRQWARKVLALPFPLEWRRWLLGAPREDRAVALFAQRNTWHERLVALRRFLSDFGELGASEPGGPFDPDHLDRTPLEVVERLEDCQKGLPWLGAWARYCRVKRRALEAGLAAIVEAGEWGELPPEGLDVAFSHSLYDRLARELLESDDQLATFDRVRHEKARREFRRADVATMRWCRWEISRSLAQRQPPAGVGRGPVREWTELALIRRECDKKRRHVPIRQLVRRAGEALQSLQPCWMMSPLSVAQFLPPGEIEFDLVVMDEASQIRPEDALGALARGRQTVIVGDTRQMPPTRFFQRTGEELDEVADEDAGSAEELESVLEAAAKCYPSSMLKWHYRSEHQRLIEFSNRAYYGGELVVFPSRYREHPQLGVQWRFVEGAVFTRRRNEVEARAVVDAILEHARDNLERAERDRESLGVATMNLHQRDLVLDLLDEESSQDERTREAIEALESFGEPLFVKNLENVQGDERDVIFVSCTYGRDAQSGKVAQRFGPLVQGGGHRRLNVLLTRARKRVVVFSSMRAEDIEGGEGKARGVNDLKRYLEFAESGAAAGDGGRVRPEGERSAFEQSVGRALASLGYEAVRRVGIAGCHVDLGVLDPDDEQTLLLGIDGDGPSYHRAACARDRERLRDEVLARRGWKLHRLWSVDWLSNHSSERERLHQALEQARQR